ncbi:MAG: hypothetical protein ACFB6R_09280 [Alphaproteobacteria bacterium]
MALTSGFFRSGCFRTVGRSVAVSAAALVLHVGFAAAHDGQPAPQQPSPSDVIPRNPGPQASRPQQPAQPQQPQQPAPAQRQPQQPAQPQQPTKPEQGQQPQIINGFTGGFLREAADVFFDQAVLRTSSNGLPIVIARQGNNTYILASQSCDTRGAQPVCRSLTMVSIYRGPYQSNALLNVNRFAQETVFGNGYLDGDRDLILEFSFRMRGVTPGYVRDNMILFRDVIVSSFRERVVRAAPRVEGGGQPIAFDSRVSGGEGSIGAPSDPEALAQRQEWKRLHAEAVAAAARTPLAVPFEQR